MFLCLELSIATLLAFYWASTKVATPSTLATIASLLSSKPKQRIARNIQGQPASNTNVADRIRENQAQIREVISNAPDLPPNRLLIDADDLLLDNPLEKEKV
jgi:hypothetical protein